MLTQRERVWLRTWFWILYLLGPLTAAVAHVTTEAMLGGLPVWLRTILRTINDWFAIWAPVLCGSLGAAYCLARLYNRRSNEEVLAFTILIGIALMISYFVLLFAGCVAAWVVSVVRASVHV